MMERVEAEFQFMTVNAAFVYWRAPGEHIHIGWRLSRFTDGVSGDDGLRTEQPVDAQQVLR